MQQVVQQAETIGTSEPDIAARAAGDPEEMKS
jgi:hypothetical protein